jgi:tetratricopeptide (TPR) repeat protein
VPHRIVFVVGLALSAVCSGTACASAKLVYTQDELKAEVARRVPGIPAAEVVAPFLIDEAHAAAALKAMAWETTEAERTRALVSQIFGPRGFHLRYASWSVTTSVEETLRRSEGNCLALAAVFVGLARAAGLDAVFIDASTRVHETRHWDRWTVNSGHVTAMVSAGRERIGLDFEQMGSIEWYRILDDLEALAHFYNNRGFEVLVAAQEPDASAWVAAARDFQIAVQIAPRFARAWNNLGIAAVHLGRPADAIEHLRTAIASDPELAAPRNNLGSVYLGQGRIAEAIETLDAASRLDPKGAHIQYNLALAQLRAGDRQAAAAALRRAIQLRGVFPEAQAALDRLGAAPAREP